MNGDFINNSGSSAIVTDVTNGGRWLIYATDPATSTEGFSSYSKHYNQPFTGSAIAPDYAESGNWFLYSIVPIVSVTPTLSQTLPGPITYGDTATFSAIYSGFIDEDTASTTGAVSDTPAWTVAGPTSSSGNPTVGTHDVAYAGGHTSTLGYQFADNTDSSNELTITTRDVAKHLYRGK